MDERTPTALIQVLGCKVNQAEVAAMASLLETRGYRVDPSAPDPDVVIVNTCCVTARAEGKSRRMVKRLADKYPRSVLVVTGCLAEVNPSSISGISDRTVVLGTFEKEHLHEVLDRSLEGRRGVFRRGSDSCTTFSDQGCPGGTLGRSRAFLKIQDGCSQGCAYCIVPQARGPSRSLPSDRVVAYASDLAQKGYGEIVLTGIHLGCYGRDLSPSLGLEDVLEMLLDACPVPRFRLSSVEPQEITPRLIQLAAQHARVCRHFHIPLQSGDDEILRRMGRPYDTAMMRELLESISRSIPDACVGLDVMVGFPGEEDRSFQNTVELIRGSGAAYLHVFPFSPRPGTRAASLRPRVPERIARKRVEQLRALSSAMRHEFYRRFLGRTLTVVAEGISKPSEGVVRARTDNYIPVRVELPPEAQERTHLVVRLTEMRDGEMVGSVTAEEA